MFTITRAANKKNRKEFNSTYIALNNYLNGKEYFVSIKYRSSFGFVYTMKSNWIRISILLYILQFNALNGQEYGESI